MFTCPVFHNVNNKLEINYYLIVAIRIGDWPVTKALEALFFVCIYTAMLTRAIVTYCSRDDCLWCLEWWDHNIS